MSELRDLRLDHLEEDVREIKTTLASLVPLINRIDERLNTELPQLHAAMATKADLAVLDAKIAAVDARIPTRGFIWGVMAAMTGAYTAALAAAALLVAIVLPRLPPPPGPPTKPAVLLMADSGLQPPPYSCRLYYDEQRKCGFGSCDARTLTRLKNECLRDGGRP